MSVAEILRGPDMADEPKVDNPIASLGGKARAAKMTPAERKESARKAAEARWAAKLPRATHTGDLNLAGHMIACAVLEDGRRVLSQESFMAAIGRTGRAKTAAMSDDGNFFKTPAFLAADNLKPFVEQYLTSASTTPIVYRPRTGDRGYGYEAKLLPLVCNVYLAARREKKLIHKQRHIAEACEVLLSALAQVGIDALVDEATGFQYSRARDELQRLLARYVSRELARWERTFQVDFYQHICRLKGWKFDPGSTKRTPALAWITADLIYDRIHPDLLKELKTVRGELGKPRQKLHQWLTTFPGGGHPRLKQHNEGVTALLSVARTWGQFQEWVDERYPKLNQTLRIPFPEDPDDEPPPALPPKG
jgi:hypothetical protein